MSFCHEIQNGCVSFGGAALGRPEIPHPKCSELNLGPRRTPKAFREPRPVAPRQETSQGNDVVLLRVEELRVGLKACLGGGNLKGKDGSLRFLGVHVIRGLRMRSETIILNKNLLFRLQSCTRQLKQNAPELIYAPPINLRRYKP